MKHINGIALIATALLLSACATMRGAPELPFDRETTDAQFAVEDKLRQLAEDNVTKEVRNVCVYALVAAIDLKFLDFKHNFQANRKHLSVLTDAMTLGMTIAGGLTNSKGVKDNYLAGIALITGSTKIFDDRYLFSQTVTALIAQMEANRETKFAAILENMGKPIDLYPGISAYHDVLDYHEEGTIGGALEGIARDAAKTRSEAKKSTKR